MNFNSRLKLSLIRAYSKESGFGVVFAITAGLTMLLVAISIILRSHEGTINAATKKQNAASLAIAETGITQTLNLINKYPVLARTIPTDSAPDNPWADLNNYASVIDCLDGGGGAAVSVSEDDAALAAAANDPDDQDKWVVVVPNTNGRYRVIEYIPDAANSAATLKVEGQHQNDATSVVEVTVPLTPRPGRVPGVWVDNIAFDEGDEPIDVSNDDSIYGLVCLRGSLDDYDLANSDYINDERLGDATTYASGNKDTTITPDIVASPAAIPPIPYLNSLTLTDTFDSMKLTDCFIVLPRILDADRVNLNFTVANIQSFAYGGLGGTKCSDVAGVSGDFNNDVTIDPTPHDGVYRYLITDALGGGTTDVSLKLNNAQIYVNPPVSGGRVEIYLARNLEVNGSSSQNEPNSRTYLTCVDDESYTYTSYIDGFINQGPPNNLTIYGTEGTTDVSVNQSIIRALVHVPNGFVDISQGQIQGAVWAKRLKSSNSGSGCKVGVEQQNIDALANKAAGVGSNISAPRRWRRVELPELPTP